MFFVFYLNISLKNYRCLYRLFLFISDKHNVTYVLFKSIQAVFLREKLKPARGLNQKAQ